MTAVMRAMSVGTGPKVLRIGVVQNGRVVEERVLKERVPVTIGPNEKCTFVVPSGHVAPLFTLFEVVGHEYVLNFRDDMTGRVALASGITDIAALKGSAEEVDGVYRVPLTDEARGKVIVGDVTFLFQFVVAPPVQPRPRLPLGVMGGLTTSMDWTLTTIAAFSFLLHFGLIGAMYSDWIDPVVGDDLNVSALVDMLKNIPVPPAVETPDQATNAPTATAPASSPSSPAKSANTASSPQTGTSRGPVSEARAAALASQAEAMQMQMLAALNGGSSVQGALNRSDIPPVDLSTAAASGAGVVPGSGDVKIGGGGAPVQASPSKGGLAAIGGGTKADGATASAGTETKVAGPTGVAEVGGATATVPVSDADRVVASLRGRFRSCYQTGLNSDPSMSGKVIVRANVGPNGEVLDVEVVQNTGLSQSVASCIAGVVRRATFSAPGGSGSSVSIPVTFVQQGK